MLDSELIEKKLLGKGVQIIAYNQGVLALSKPSGIKSHPNKAGIDTSALLKLPYDQKAECYLLEDKKIHLLHRLDAPTSGLIILSDKDPVAKSIREQFAEHTAQKTYHAVVNGRAGRLKQTWRDRIRVTRNKGILRAAIGGGDPAITAVKGLKENPKRGISLLELKPETGRTHQLRVQCNHRRLPILGDANYGNFSLNKRIQKETKDKRLFLHACQLEIQLEGKRKLFKCPLPDIYEQILAK